MSRNRRYSIQNSGSSIPVQIIDQLEIITGSPSVTQALLNAVVKLITKHVGSMITSVIIEVSQLKAETMVTLNKQQIIIRISMLETAADLCANALRNAETQNYPEPMKKELTDRLWGIFYEEMAKVAPKPVQ